MYVHSNPHFFEPVLAVCFRFPWNLPFLYDFPRLGIGAEARKIFLRWFRAQALALFLAMWRERQDGRPVVLFTVALMLSARAASAEIFSLSKKFQFPGLRKYIILISLVVRVAHKLESPNLATSQFYQSRSGRCGSFRVYQNHRGRSISAIRNFDFCQEIRWIENRSN